MHDDPHDQQQPKKRRSRVTEYSAFALVGQVGLTIALSMFFGVLAGLFVDSKLHTSPIATLLGLLLGLAAGVFGVFRLISNLE